MRKTKRKNDSKLKLISRNEELVHQLLSRIGPDLALVISNEPEYKYTGYWLGHEVATALENSEARPQDIATFLQGFNEALHAELPKRSLKLVS